GPGAGSRVTAESTLTTVPGGRVAVVSADSDRSRDVIRGRMGRPHLEEGRRARPGAVPEWGCTRRRGLRSVVAKGSGASQMDVFTHDADFDADGATDAAAAARDGGASGGAGDHGRWARHLDNRRRFRRRLAIGLAAAGVGAIVV